MRSFASLVWYPLALGSSLLVAWSLLGVSPEIASFAGTMVGMLFTFVGELLLRHADEWRWQRDELKIDLLSLIVSSALLPMMQLLVDRGLRAVYVPSDLWPDSAPLLVQVALALVWMDMIQYTTHRAMHTSPYLWRFHAMHHSTEQMQMWSAFRNHPIDTFLTVALPVAPLSWLGASPEVVALSVALVGANATLQHSNIELRDDVWSWIFSTAGLHRVHHHRDAVVNGNFGGLLICWDLLFRTRKTSAEKVPALGISGLDWFPKKYLGQLWSPFSSKWRA
jgi:sterol desaturase/sphingolipid hydroxylase (fatty acid hydroxylase superfamily)